MKSDLPVHTINAPAALASSGIISGTGLAKAKIIDLAFINFIHSAFNAPAAETPTNTSAFLSIVAKSPCSLLGLVISEIYFFISFIFSFLPL